MLARCNSTTCSVIFNLAAAETGRGPVSCCKWRASTTRGRWNNWCGLFRLAEELSGEKRTTSELKYVLKSFLILNIYWGLGWETEGSRFKSQGGQNMEGALVAWGGARTLLGYPWAMFQTPKCSHRTLGWSGNLSRGGPCLVHPPCDPERDKEDKHEQNIWYCVTNSLHFFVFVRSFKQWKISPAWSCVWSPYKEQQLRPSPFWLNRILTRSAPWVNKTTVVVIQHRLGMTYPAANVSPMPGASHWVRVALLHRPPATDSICSQHLLLRKAGGCLIFPVCYITVPALQTSPI